MRCCLCWNRAESKWETDHFEASYPGTSAVSQLLVCDHEVRPGTSCWNLGVHALGTPFGRHCCSTGDPENKRSRLQTSSDIRNTVFVGEILEG
jgi:hypothetical protein